VKAQRATSDGERAVTAKFLFAVGDRQKIVAINLVSLDFLNRRSTSLPLYSGTSGSIAIADAASPMLEQLRPRQPPPKHSRGPRHSGLAFA